MAKKYYCKIQLESAGVKKIIGGVVSESVDGCIEWANASFPLRPGESLTVFPCCSNEWPSIERLYIARRCQIRDFKRWMNRAAYA